MVPKTFSRALEAADSNFSSQREDRRIQVLNEGGAWKRGGGEDTGLQLDARVRDALWAPASPYATDGCRPRYGSHV